MAEVQGNVFSFPSKTKSLWCGSDDNDSVIATSRQGMAVYGSSASPPKTVFIESGAHTEEFAYIAAKGGSGGNDMEARLAKLEATVSHIQSDLTDIKQDIGEFRKENRDDFASVRAAFASAGAKGEKDFRLLFGSLITATVGLAAIMAKGFGWF